MALTIADRVLQTGSANTTASFTLSGSVSGYQSFAVVGNGNTTYYGAQDGTNWEVGIGTYSTTGPTLTRTTVISSSNSGSAVSTFTSPVTVYVTQPSEYAVYVAGSNIVVPNSAILGTANGGTGLNTFTANGIVFASTTAVLATATGLTWNGTTFNALAVTSGGNAVLTTANYNSYALPLSGGTMTGTITGGMTGGSQALDFASNDNYVSMRVIRNNKSGSPNNDGMYIGYQNTNSGITRIFGGGATGGGISVQGSGNSDCYVNGNVILNAGNYNSYAPTLTGTGASGTWGINVSGYAQGAQYVAGSFNRTDSTAYPVVWMANQGTQGGVATSTLAFSCAAVTIQSSTGLLSATNLTGSTSIYNPGYCYGNNLFLNSQGDASSTTTGVLTFWADTSVPTTTSAILFKNTSVYGEHGYTSGGYNTYFIMDTSNRGWVFRNASPGGTNMSAGTNVASISNTGNAYFNGTTYSTVYAGAPGVTWGAIQVTGTNAGYAGIYYPSQGGAVNMIGSNSGGATGMYNSSTTTWQWYFTNSNGAQSTLTTGLVSATQIVGNGATGAATNLSLSGDITTYRSTTAGVVFLGSSGNHYIYNDGSNYYTPNGNLVVSGGYITANSSINAGTYITATTYFYTPSSSAAAQYVGNWAGSYYWGIGPYSASNDQNIKIGQASSSSGTWGSGGNLIVAGSLSTGNSTAGTFFGSSNTLRVNGSGGGELLIASSTTASILEFQVSSGGSWHVQNSGGVFYITQTSVADRFYINGAAVTIPGSLSKGSGTFDIDHPSVPNMRLRHSFVEGPRVDLIYRGHATLTVGTVTVDMDINAMSQGGQTMTPGTFVALTRDPDIYLQNTTGWSPVKGSINGSKLTIICQDQTSTDTISWMVVAERKDQHLHDDNIEMTDDHGRLILEYKNNRTSGPTQPGEAVHTYHDPNS